MSDDNSIRMDHLDTLDIDPNDVMGKSNMVRLDDEVALRLAIMDELTPGRTTKRSLVEEAVESYYDRYFGKVDGDDEVSSVADDELTRFL